MLSKAHFQELARTPCNSRIDASRLMALGQRGMASQEGYCEITEHRRPSNKAQEPLSAAMPAPAAQCQRRWVDKP